MRSQCITEGIQIPKSDMFKAIRYRPKAVLNEGLSVAASIPMVRHETRLKRKEWSFCQAHPMEARRNLHRGFCCLNT